VARTRNLTEGWLRKAAVVANAPMRDPC